MNGTRRSGMALWALIGTAIMGTAPAMAADDLGITVMGQGESLIRPDCLEIDVLASGSAELTGDAIIKYRDHLRRVNNAFKKLNVKQLHVQPQSLSIGDTTDEERARPQVTIARALRVVITDIKDLSEDDLLTLAGKVIDTVKDAGIKGDEPQAGETMIRFVVRDAKAVRETASQKAFAQAREEAAKLATLADGRLGRVLSVQDVSAATEQGAMAEAIPMAISETVYALYGGELERERDGRIVSSSLRDIPVRVSLRVRFELLHPPAERPKADVEGSEAH
ncbi:MAG TPA: SIMPL domain-containing protein [Pirellulales bacterium]|nr:SIMPL domain-containing protein [Pirellulales bacterium]